MYRAILLHLSVNLWEEKKRPENRGRAAVRNYQPFLRVDDRVWKEVVTRFAEIGGNLLDSVAFSQKIETLGIQGISHITFIIGGSIGLGKEVLQRSNFALSFSKMTFPHQLMRVILLEQIYRGYRIMAGEPYHK